MVFQAFFVRRFTGDAVAALPPYTAFTSSAIPCRRLGSAA
jgi:hypothetical protein